MNKDIIPLSRKLSPENTEIHPVTLMYDRVNLTSPSDSIRLTRPFPSPNRRKDDGAQQKRELHARRRWHACVNDTFHYCAHGSVQRGGGGGGASVHAVIQRRIISTSR